MELALRLLQGGLDALVDYLSLHVLTCLIPAFFIGGAIAVFVSQGAVLKYFGPSAGKLLSYGVASVSGTVLAVCSCTVLPLFGAVYRRGSGLGPAIAFLYAGPAINILAIVYSARLLGYDLGVGRALGAVVFSVAIGLMMAALFRERQRDVDAALFDALAADPGTKKPWQQVVFFAILVGVLIAAASGQWIATGGLLGALVVVLWRWFSRAELRDWMRETFRFVRLVVPWLLVGVFVAGVLKEAIPESAVAGVVGGSGPGASFIASGAGALMYFATLTEVPIVRAFMDLGMGKGPALALLLAGPAVSLPNMLVIRGIMGTKKTLVYIALVVAMATVSGYVFGLIVR